jgi:hypothetical protein
LVDAKQRGMRREVVEVDDVRLDIPPRELAR